MPSRRTRRAGAQRGGQTSPGTGPAWNWWTFPVYFALATGLIVGYNAGVVIPPHSRAAGIANFAFAIPFSFGLAQVVTRPVREMMLRRRAQRERRTSV
jgi:hypothetical protein